MPKVNGFYRILMICGALALVVAWGAVSHAEEVKGTIEIPIPVRACQTDGDTAIIGVGAAIDLGDEVGIPIYVGSDDCIETWRFLFDLPDAVTDISQVRVEANSWPYEIDELWIDFNGYLVVERSIGAGCDDPDLDDVFITLYIDTHCWATQDAIQDVKFGPPGYPMDPDIFLGIDGGCSRDPLEYLQDGSFSINPINISFDIGQTTGLIGDVITVTVTCDNDYEFKSFRHRITYDQTVLEWVDPYIEAGDRDFDTLYAYPPGTDYFYVYGRNWTGLGTTADGLDLYRLHFKVISLVEDIEGDVSFNFDFGLLGVWAVDCWQHLDEFTDIGYANGSVTVPAYRATFDIGHVHLLNDDLNEVHVPLYLKNNYRIFEFRLPMKYVDDPDDPLEFIGFESANPSDFVGFGQVCEDYQGDGYKYAVLMTQGLTEIDTSSESRYIGDLIFQNTVARPGVEQYYSLKFVDLACDEYDNWVHTWDEVRDETEYGWLDLQTSFLHGSIHMADPTVWIYAISAWGWGENPWQDDSQILVRSNVALDDLDFTVSWTPDAFCVTAFDELPNTEVIVDEGALEATVAIDGLAPAYSYYPAAAKLLFENATYSNQSGDLDITDVVAVETIPSGRLRIVAVPGVIHLDAVPVHMQTCDELFVLRKDAAVPYQFELMQNYPNPFNASTMIDFTLPTAGHTTLEVYNIMGQRVVTLMDDFAEAGPYSIFWNGRDNRGSVIASGIYLYRLRSGQHLDTKKLVLMK